MQDGLNAPQRAAVSTLSGPLLVLAGAGTGKTRVITYRIANLIRHGTGPERILGVTFTNKAAREMRERALGLLGKRRRNAGKPEISTFHAYCVRVLRRHAPLLGYPKNFVIHDRGDQEVVARNALRELRVAQDRLRPGDFLALVSTWKSAGLDPERAAQNALGERQELAAHAYARYQQALRASGAVDFDDLLLLTVRLFREHAEARFAEASRFDHLLVDEYQDTNQPQYRVIQALAERHRNLCVVGDDDQSIYAWRGAEVAHILRFQRDWPEAKVVKLEDNYRCREPILGLANRLIAVNSVRHDKVLRAARGGGDAPRTLRFDDEVAEAEHVIGDLASRLAAPGEERWVASDFAILFRTNEQPRPFEQELRKRRIPYVLVGGQSFFDRKEVKDLVAYLKVLAQPHDEVSLLRILNVPPRGIGAGSVEALLGEAVARGAPLWAVLPEATAKGLVPGPVAERIASFRRLLERLRTEAGTRPLPEVLRSLLAETDYDAELRRVSKNPDELASRRAAVEDLQAALDQYAARAEAPSLLGFLEEVTLDRHDDEAPERQVHAVTLMTLHSAKGLEFPHVYLVGMEEGLLPHKRSIGHPRHVEEERRLAYVGITRARETLTLTLCKARMKWGKLRPAIPSRFLMEMKGDLAKAREVAEAAERDLGVAPDEPEPGDAPAAPPPRAAGRARQRASSAPNDAGDATRAEERAPQPAGRARGTTSPGRRKRP